MKQVQNNLLQATSVSIVLLFLNVLPMVLNGQPTLQLVKVVFHAPSSNTDAWIRLEKDKDYPAEMISGPVSTESWKT